MIGKKNNEKKQAKQKQKLRRSAQNAIKYDKMMQDGTCIYGDGLFSQTLEFEDINYLTENDDQRQKIFSQYMQLLNSVSNDYDFQMTIVNTPISVEEFDERVYIKKEDDEFNALRDEWNKSLDKKIMSNFSRIQTRRFFTYTVKEDNLDKARNSLNIVTRELKNKLMLDLKAKSHLLNGIERLDLIHGILQPDKDFIFNYDQINPSFTTKDAITPDSIDFRKSDMFRINERYCKVFYLKNWSTEIFDEIIYRLSKLQFNQVISLHMKSIKRGEDISLIKTQIAQMEMEKMTFQRKALDRGYDPEMLPQEFQYTYNEAKAELEDVQQRNQRLFDCQFLIMLNAATEQELATQEADIQSIFKENSCVLGVLNFEQENGFNATLPIGNMYSGKTRLLTTSAVSAFLPFVSKEVFEDSGLYYGVNSTTGNLLYIDRRKLPNGNGWEFGTPGSGKSFGAKREMYLVALSTKDDMVIIDPEREYPDFIKWLGGEVVNVSLNGKERINPWEGDMSNRDFLTNKVQFAQTYSATIMGGDGLSAKEKSIIDRVARKMYGNYAQRLKDHGKKAIPPTGLEYFNLLKEQDEPEARNLAVSHELYSTGSYNIFSDQSNVNADNRIMCYGIRDLDEVLKPLGMMVILESLWNRIIENRDKGIRTWIWCDEIYLLFKYDYSANFFYELFKRARKYGAIITGITQDVEDLLENSKARSMLANSSFVMMFNQSQNNGEELADILNISDAQLEHLLRAKPGSGVIAVGNDLITFEDEADKDTELYKMATTKFSEVHSSN